MTSAAAKRSETEVRSLIVRGAVRSSWGGFRQMFDS